LKRLPPAPIAFLALVVASISLMTTSAGAAGKATKPHVASFCDRTISTCPDTRVLKNYEGEYVGHDEPSLVFYSGRKGSGNSNVWKIRLPKESPVQPKQDGTGGTWNFQQHATFWFGMALCESESYPTPGQPCTPNSDANIKNSNDPLSPNWIGNHVGTGFLELQLYPPGWAPWPPGISCDATKWCAAMVTFGLSDNLDQTNNQSCLDIAGEEFANFAFLTLSGTPHAPPSPLAATDATFTPNPATDLFMNAGDELSLSIHDSKAGLVTALKDTTSGQTGSMTASVANGFAHPVFDPNAATCTQTPYALHPMYSTTSPDTVVPWAAHTYNVAASDEIGHFEYCNKVNAMGQCTVPGVQDPAVDDDDAPCFPASVSLLVKVTGCIGEDLDFDGSSYQKVWPGTDKNVAQDQLLHAQPITFTSPLTKGHNYSRVAFEADLPAIESQVGCNIFRGTGCVNPPPGAAFYPLYTTTGGKDCAWRQGGPYLPNTDRSFGGTSTKEYGHLLTTWGADFPNAPGTVALILNFQRRLSSNPCDSSGHLPS
jgi:hypothetical protein